MVTFVFTLTLTVSVVAFLIIRLADKKPLRFDRETARLGGGLFALVLSFFLLAVCVMVAAFPD